MSLSHAASLGHLVHLQPSGDVPFSRPQSPHKELIVGFYGLGAMGYSMARNLTKNLPSPLRVSNRSRSRAEQLLKELGETKVKIVDNPANLALEADIIFTNLANDTVVREAYEGFVAALKVRTCRMLRSPIYAYLVSCYRVPIIPRTRYL